MSAILPQGFEALEPFVERWAVAGTANRARRRSDSTADERLAFFNAGQDLIPPALELLDGKPLGQLNAQEQRLMDVVLAFAHVAIAVEVQGDAEDLHARLRDSMRIVRAAADYSP